MDFTKIIISLGLVLSACAFADRNPNALSGGIDGTFGIDAIVSESPWQTYILTPLDPEKGRHFIYGYHITFDSEKKTFESRYTAPCGNDCFPWSKGTYFMEGESHIRLYLSRVGQFGMCSSYERDVGKDLGLFLVEKDAETRSVILTAVER